MLNFKQFIIERERPILRHDNPGGDWEKRERDKAESKYHYTKGYSGSVTAYFMNKQGSQHMKLKTDALKNIPGKEGEEKFRSSGSKLKNLEKSVGHPSNFDTKKYPIAIGVNHKGEAHVLEGNHRLEYAKKHNIPHIHSEVRYFNGGEKVKGKFHPDEIEKIRAD